MRCIPLETAGRGKVVAEDGRVFHIGDEVTVEAKKNLNDGVGEFETIKKQVFLDRFALLRKINHRNETAFKRIEGEQ